MNIEIIPAETHTSEYLMHKYWARKPHNVISHFLKQLVPENGYVLDPFMGSGVVIKEAMELGFNAYGIDINPVAYNISFVLTCPPKKEKFEEIVYPIIDNIKEIVNKSYSLTTGEEIKYNVHKIITSCPMCKEKLETEDCIFEKKKYYCFKCGELVHFNLEHLNDTSITKILAIENNNQLSFINIESKKNKTTICFSKDEFKRQQEESKKNIMNVDLNKYNYNSIENRRILAYKGMKTADLFTTRNFSILTYLADEFHKIEDESIRNAALCLLTGASAQCSRLIANRNDLSTGGPAWSVPGFWVPQEHLETNPIIHLLARYKKMISGLEKLDIINSKKPHLYKKDSLEILKNKEFKNKFDLIFLDPPYGDNIPYTEFSYFWNSFLNEVPDVKKDISVSDRLSSKEAWNKYKLDLDNLFKLLPVNLNKNGKLLITFNNIDIKAWKSLLKPLQNNKFKCIRVNYQIPAVISSKASFCPTSSYISDIYSIYELDNNSVKSNDINKIEEKLIICASSRNRIIQKSIVDREFIISLMENNIDVEFLDKKEEIINKLFDFKSKKEGIYELKEEFFNESVEKLDELINKFVFNEKNKGENDLLILYKTISPMLYKYGIPELYEFKKIINY